MDLVANLLLNPYAFLRWETESSAFWILLVLFLICFYGSMTLTEEKPTTSIFLTLICAGIVYLYSGMSGEVFWFLNIEKVGWLIMLFAFYITAMLFGTALGYAWGYLKFISLLSSNFWFSVFGITVGCVWGYLLYRLGRIIFDEHPILCFLTLMGALGIQAKSSNEQEKESQKPEPKPGRDPYRPQGFPCCDNCRWNQNRGSYTVRCFQDSSRRKKSNDKCGQWQHY